MLELLLVISSIVCSSSFEFPATTITLETGHTLYVSGVSSSDFDFVKTNLNCDLMCASTCLSSAKGFSSLDCTRHCGCSSLISESSDFSVSSLKSSIAANFVTDLTQTLQTPTNEDQVKWWISTKTAKTRTYEMCTAECSGFCQNYNGDSETCESSCVTRFCKQQPKGFPVWIFSLLCGLFLAMCLVIKVTADQIKVNSEFEVSLGYRKI